MTSLNKARKLFLETAKALILGSDKWAEQEMKEMKILT